MAIAKVKHIIAIILLCSLFLLTSCARPSMPEVRHNDCALWNVKLEGANPEFVEDYIYLWDLLENEYPFLAAAERITGKNAEEIKEKYYYRIKTVATTEDFFSFVISPCLNEFGFAGHLTAITLDSYQWRYVAPDKLENYSEFHLQNAKQLLGEKTLEFYADAIPIENPDEAANPADPVKDNLIFQYYPEQSAAYVEILGMNYYADSDNPEYNALAEFFAKIEAEGYENCIIDIRRNGGGSDSYWRYGIVKPNSAESIHTVNYGLIEGDICAHYASKHPLVEVKPISELPYDELPKLNPEDLEEATHFMEMVIDNPYSENGEVLFSGKFWLLIGPRVYSSSEALAIFCKQTGFATIVGTNSGGDGVGINPMILSLPATGILVHFSSLNGLNPDGSCNEEFSTTPDYFIGGKEDALTKCLELIDEQVQ